MAIHWQCVRCTECCRWPGRVELAESEIDALAAFLGVAPREFIERYTQLRSDRRGLALRDAADGACVFLDGRDCRVQPAKPRQCREFPNGWNFPGFEKLCRAIPTQVAD
jgi:Fe-S-cluster containining protein